MIEKLVEQKINVTVSFIDKSIRMGVITAFEPVMGIIELETKDGVLIIPLSSVINIFYKG